MASFALPQYVRAIDEMPKTPTAKIEKHRLRAEGVTAGTWTARPTASPSVAGECSGWGSLALLD
jgi:hypothetical protein